MSLFKHTYSGIITKGLGLPACCGLLTVGFGVFGCTIEVVEPPISIPSGGGGGIGFGRSVPLKKPTTRIINIRVTLKDGRSWSQRYTVSTLTSGIVIKVINLINSASTKITVGVSQTRRAITQVIARFKDTDK